MKRHAGPNHKWTLIEGTYRCRRCGAFRKVWLEKPRFWFWRWRLAGDNDWLEKCPECKPKEKE